MATQNGGYFMCGITGMIHLEQDLRQQEALLRKMQETLRRRGPDQEGIFLSPRCAMAHTRLAVIDVEKGRQPMEITAGGETYTIVYNGELYNTSELRTQLEQEGVVFQTHCDTEVVLQSYAHWGPRCVEQCNGIFAFAVWEHTAQRLFLARDRIGVKPLFYAEIPGGLVFGSEIKALLQHPDVPHEIDQNGVADLLLLGPGRTPGYGVFRTIREVKPAHCGYYMQGSLHLHPYWELHAAVHTDSFAETAAHVRELLTDAVRRQLVSDVPIGTFLSGGLDSSLVCAIAAKKLGKPIRTFAIGMDTDAIDLKYARQTAEYLGSEHHEIIINRDMVINSLEEVIRLLGTWDITTIRASMGMYLLCKAIHEQTDVRVLLTGEISDELFGYKYTDYAPTADAFQQESQKRIRELYMYDVLRADRCISANSIEARVPLVIWTLCAMLHTSSLCYGTKGLLVKSFKAIDNPSLGLMNFS